MTRNLPISDSEYTLVHLWMKQNYGKPQHCESCLTTEKRMYHWANISGTYKRDREDWLRLCVPCHKRHDIKALGGTIKARPRMVQPVKPCKECGTEFVKNRKFSPKQWAEANFCSKPCRTASMVRKKTGMKQSAETSARKSQIMKERWATNMAWREANTKRMLGNKYAIGISNERSH